jgi:hypothetical protein
MTSIQTESHTVTIDYRQTLDHMIAAGAYDQGQPPRPQKPPIRGHRRDVLLESRSWPFVSVGHESPPKRHSRPAALHPGGLAPAVPSAGTDRNDFRAGLARTSRRAWRTSIDTTLAHGITAYAAATARPSPPGTQGPPASAA